VRYRESRGAAWQMLAPIQADGQQCLYTYGRATCMCAASERPMAVVPQEPGACGDRGLAVL